MPKSVKIVISGATMSGKTRILNIIGEALRNSGFNVEATDDVGDISEFKPFLTGQLDDRLISIFTVLTPFSQVE